MFVVSRLAFWLVFCGVILGKETAPSYVDLTQWARGHRLDVRPNYQAKSIALTNEWTQLVFRQDSAQMAVEGIELRLSYPLRKQGIQWQVAARDVDTVLNPLLSPPKRVGKRPIRTIAIGAGHGGNDPGNVAGPKKEKVYTLELGRALRPILEKAGFKVIMLRESDTRVELEERAELANLARADLFISLHFNGFPGLNPAGVSGIETYCLTPAGASSSNDSGRNGGSWMRGNRLDKENVTLAYWVHRALVEQLDLPDRGVRRARFKELTLLEMPGILVEGGYLTNDKDISVIDSVAGRNHYARAIADGIIAYKRLLERGQPEEPR